MTESEETEMDYERQVKIDRCLFILNKLQIDALKNGRLRGDDREEWNRTQREIRELGYRSHAMRVPDGWLWYVKPAEEAPRRQRHFRCEWVKKDVSPDEKHLKGNCTTRAMTYCLPQMTYREIEDEQYRLAAEAKFASRRDGHMVRYCRNSRGVWEKVLLKRGYVQFSIRRPTRADRVANALSAASEPMVCVSSHHAAVIHGGKVVDSWDSRGKRVQKLIVKAETEQMVRSLLAKCGMA